MYCCEIAYSCPFGSLEERRTITERYEIVACSRTARTTRELTSVQCLSRQTLKLTETVQQETVLVPGLTRNVEQFAVVSRLNACKVKVP